MSSLLSHIRIQLLLLLLLLLLMLLLLVGVVASAAADDDDADEQREFQYCVIGAGPAGLQMGYHLKQQGRSYVILERADSVASHYIKYPIHRNLISINKRATGKADSDFQLRHDWNSILSDNTTMRMTRYSDRLWPLADTLVEYLRDYAKVFDLNVQLNTEVVAVRPSKKTATSYKPFRHQPFDVSIKQMGKKKGKYHCGVMVVATGWGKPVVPDFVNNDIVTGYEDLTQDSTRYFNQSVIVLGMGNAAFETAQAISPEAAIVQVLGRKRVKLSWDTHYVGDVRAINNDILDNYMLKTLDAVSEGPLEQLLFERDEETGKINVVVAGGLEDRENYGLRIKYDAVIRCMGFRFNPELFCNRKKDKSCVNPRLAGRAGDGKGKFLAQSAIYESVNVPGMYAAGAQMHMHDFRKAAGGFIHGFRYSVRALSRIMALRYHNDDAWALPDEGYPDALREEHAKLDPNNVDTSRSLYLIPTPAAPSEVNDLRIEAIVQRMVERMRTSSGLYQMFGIHADVLLLYATGVPGDRAFARYLEEVPLHALQDSPLLNLLYHSVGAAAQSHTSMAHLRQREVSPEEAPPESGRSRGGLFGGSRAQKKPSVPMDNLVQYVTMTFEYGEGFSGVGKDNFRMFRSVGSVEQSHLSAFLHPVFRFWQINAHAVQTGRVGARQAHVLRGEVHLLEDFAIEWDLPITHQQPMRRFLREILDPVFDTDPTSGFAGPPLVLSREQTVAKRRRTQARKHDPFGPALEDMMANVQDKVEQFDSEQSDFDGLLQPGKYSVQSMVRAARIIGGCLFVPTMSCVEPLQSLVMMQDSPPEELAGFWMHEFPLTWGHDDVVGFDENRRRTLGAALVSFSRDASRQDAFANLLRCVISATLLHFVIKFLRRVLIGSKKTESTDSASDKKKPSFVRRCCNCVKNSWRKLKEQAIFWTILLPLYVWQAITVLLLADAVWAFIEIFPDLEDRGVNHFLNWYKSDF